MSEGSHAACLSFEVSLNSLSLIVDTAIPSITDEQAASTRGSLFLLTPERCNGGHGSVYFVETETEYKPPPAVM